MSRGIFSLTNLDNTNYKSNDNFDRYITNTDKFYNNSINNNLKKKISIEEFDNIDNCYYRKILKKNFKKKTLPQIL